MPAHPKPPLVRLLISLGACTTAGSITALWMLPKVSPWLANLRRPAFLPQDSWWLPAVMFVYLLLGFTLYLLWQASRVNDVDKKLCLALLWFSVILLSTWGYFFFGLESPIMGMLVGTLAVAMLIAAMVQSVRVSFGATLLLFLLVILVFLAAYANYVILVANPGLAVFGR